MTKAKKLPTIWIKYPSCEVLFHPELGAHRYTPAKPAKQVCRCGTGTFAYSEGYKFCNLETIR